LLAFAVSPSSASWRNILAGLELLEHLLEKGSMELWRECARGEHFDASQRLLFLSTYTNPDDPRVTKLIRTKARMIREKVMAKNEQVESLRVSAPERTTRGHASSSADSTERSSSSSENEEPSKDTEAEGSARAPAASKNPSIISGFAVVGHNPDTSDSEDEHTATSSLDARRTLCATTGGTPTTNYGGKQRSKLGRRRHHSAEDFDTETSQMSRNLDAPRSNSAPAVDLL
ncbi:hypothetical protein FOZ63_007225, partial [Perkinsus olseni]